MTSSLCHVIVAVLAQPVALYRRFLSNLQFRFLDADAGSGRHPAAGQAWWAEGQTTHLLQYVTMYRYLTHRL
jgi:hypothetical protein